MQPAFLLVQQKTHVAVATLALRFREGEHVLLSGAVVRKDDSIYLKKR